MSEEEEEDKDLDGWDRAVDHLTLILAGIGVLMLLAAFWI